MRVIVTGAGGFVGRGLVAALAADHDVVAIDRDCAGLAADRVRALPGDFADPAILAAAFGDGCDAVVHLATVPGGAAEQDPALAFSVNVAGTAALAEAARACGPVRFLFASSIAVIGDPMPAAVDDTTPLRPRMLYGAHKAMTEQWLATLSRRGDLDALSLRLPGIVARPRRPSGMKSAFLSNLFHAARGGERFLSPVSEAATIWLMSRPRIVRNLMHALGLPRAAAGEPFAITLPAVRTSMAALVGEIARQCGSDPGLVAYEPDPALEAGFGAQPPLATPGAESLGFASDGSLATLVAAALSAIDEQAAEMVDG